MALALQSQQTTADPETLTFDDCPLHRQPAALILASSACKDSKVYRAAPRRQPDFMLYFVDPCLQPFS